MAYPHPFDFRNPDYVKVFRYRMERLERIRKNPAVVPALKKYYKENPIDFIEDWGVSADPRNIDYGLPAVVPLILFPRQKEFLQWVIDRWKASEFGLSDKSRDMGLSWMLCALAATLCLFNDNFIFGFGSRKQEYVDASGDPKSLFWKIRAFLNNVPREFRGGWHDRAKGNKHMLITIPDNGSVINGECGDNIGRGGRSTIYAVDEAAFIERPHLIDAALSQNTRCRIDISSVNGMDNPFAEKRFSWPEHRIFTFHWRDDPRKDDAWYEQQKANTNPIIVAQEIDLDYSASKEGVLIPSAWTQSAIGAARKLGIKVSGDMRSSLDVADEGIDLNAFAGKFGIELRHLEAWSGKGSHIFQTVEKAFMLCDKYGYPVCRYDSDGLGAGVRGDAAQINGRPERAGSKRDFVPFRGSGAVVNPDKLVFKGDDRGVGARKNEDFFANLKAQAWWELRTRFEKTHRAVTEGVAFNPDELISISEDLPVTVRTKLVSELSQPTYSINTAGKLIVDKTPDGQRSPNHADAVMMLYAPTERKSRLFG